MQPHCLFKFSSESSQLQPSDTTQFSFAHSNPNFIPLFRCLALNITSTTMAVLSAENSSPDDSKLALVKLAPLEAVLFDIDGTLCDSDPLHYYAFREMLQEIGYNGGVPIDEEFFSRNISGKHNDDIARFLFPDDFERGLKFTDDKETYFRRLAKEQLKPLDGLYNVVRWVEDHGLKRAAVTNAPRPNAELMISILGLSEFFQAVIIGSECEYAKPHPTPYLKALEEIKASKEHTFIFEDSPSGIKAGVAAGMPVIGVGTRNPESLLMEAKPAFLIKDYNDPKLWVALEELEKQAGLALDIPSTMVVSSAQNSSADDSKLALVKLAPLEAVLFDIDGTLCDSDPLHYYAFREMLQEIGYNGGVPIDEEFFIQNIAGKHSDDIARALFPDDFERGLKFNDDKEAYFRRLVKRQLKPLDGLYKVVKWVEDHGLKRAAVTNAPRPNAELMISILGLSEFFEAVIVGSECEHAKPHPEPYLKALEEIKAPKEHTFIFEDSPSGIKAGATAGMPVIGITTRNPASLLMEAKPTFLIKDYEDPKLWAALDELEKQGGVKANAA